MLMSSNQSHYIEVGQGDVSSRAIHNWLWIFRQSYTKKKKDQKQSFIKKYIMQLFSADATMFF